MVQPIRLNDGPGACVDEPMDGLPGLTGLSRTKGRDNRDEYMKHTITILLLLAFVLPASAQQWPDRTKLPIPLPPFEGKIGKTYEDSESNGRLPWRPQRARPM